MNKTYLLAAAIGIVAVVGVSGVWAADGKMDSSVLRGSALIQGVDGRWQEASSVPVGKWVRSAKSETTLRVPGMVVRVDSGASVRLTKSKDGLARLDARGGKVFVKVDSEAVCVVSTKNKQVSADHAEFVLDAGPMEDCYVVDGNPQVTDLRSAPGDSARAWKKFASQVALDGPDVRNRSKNRRRFTQGEGNKGKKLTEDPIKPLETASPAYTPAPSVTPTAPAPQPSPTAPPQQNPPPQVGGGSPWPWIGGILGAGGLAAFIILNDDDDDDNRVVFPASP